MFLTEYLEGCLEGCLVRYNGKIIETDDMYVFRDLYDYLEQDKIYKVENSKIHSGRILHLICIDDKNRLRFWYPEEVFNINTKNIISRKYGLR